MTDQARQAISGSVGGLVLAGGRSSRFGSDKAVASLGGRPLLLWSLAALAGGCAAVAVSARPGGEAEALARSLGHAMLADDPAHPAGPLAGLAAGLAWAAAQGFDRLVTLPCDTPLVGAGVIGALLAAMDGARAAFAMTSEGPQPLCAVWRSDLARPLGACLAGGSHPPVQGFLVRIGAAPVLFEDPLVFRNANTREALTRLEADVAAL